MKLLIPSYFYASDPAWDKILAAGADHQIEVIINPNSGPGLSIDPVYKTLCIRLRKAGISTLGYVSTRWGDRPMDEVKDNILKYSAWYGVESMFLDEAATGVDKLDFYRALYAHIPGKVVLNHGAIPDSRYLECGDVLVIFESDYEKHKTVKFPTWITNREKHRLAQIVFNAPKAMHMGRTMKKIKQTSGWAYVTDDVLPNPYDQLPAYFESLLSFS